MIDNPELIVQFLAKTLPAQSSYFIQLLFVFTFLINGFELLRVAPLGYALVRRFVGPNLTEKERSRKWKFLYSLEEPPHFWHAETFSQIVLVSQETSGCDKTQYERRSHTLPKEFPFFILCFLPTVLCGIFCLCHYFPYHLRLFIRLLLNFGVWVSIQLHS